MVIAIFILITIKPMIEYGEIETILISLALTGMGFSTMIFLLIEKGIIQKIFAVIWGMLFGGVPFIQFILPTLLEDKMYLLMYIIGLICIAVLILFIKIMPKRTPYGNEMLGKLNGFRRFLETAEKPQLEALVNENPKYFYNILPYTYALEVSDVWMKKFETIALQAPQWYAESDTFEVHQFNNFMNNTMNSAQSAMSASPSDSSGGSSSGGGSSGGGSGGGGGSSW